MEGHEEQPHTRGLATCRQAWPPVHTHGGHVAPLLKSGTRSADTGVVSSLTDMFRHSGPEGRRIGRRVDAPDLLIDWHPSGVNGRRWGRRPELTPRALVLDLSLTGAKVLVTANQPELQRGTEVRIGLHSASGSCRVVRVEPAAAGRMAYGIEYLELEPALRDVINGLVSADRSSLDQRWEHAR